jgi:hypothetical protein
LKFYAYLFHLGVCGFLLGIAILARTGNQALRLEMLPFNQGDLISRVSLLSLIGFICILLALARIFEFVFPLWSLAVVIVLVWGFFFTSYSFEGVKGLQSALLFVLAAILALYGSILVLMPKRRKQW